MRHPVFFSIHAVHQENGIDYPIDMQAIYYCFTGLPKGINVPNSTSVSYSELKVSDLEDLQNF